MLRHQYVLGMCLFVKMVTSIPSEDPSTQHICQELAATCLQKFEKFHANRLCRYLKEAIHCLNNSEAVLCGQDSTNGTPVQRTSHSNQSSGEFPKIYQPDADRDIWRADFGNNTHGSRSTSGTAGNVQSEAPLFDITDKTATLHDLIEEASKEYQKLCPHSVAGSFTSQITWTAGAFLIGCILTLYATQYFVVNISNM